MSDDMVVGADFLRPAAAARSRSRTVCLEIDHARARGVDDDECKPSFCHQRHLASY